MLEARRATSSRAVAVVVVAGLLVVGLWVGSSGVLNARSSVNPNLTVEKSNSTIGISLILSVNSTTIPSEDAITVSTSVTNTRSTANNVTAADDWPIQGLATEPCLSKSVIPDGIAVFRGYYGINNVSSAAPVGSIFSPIRCPAFPVVNATSYLFLPDSDAANYSGYTTQVSPPQQPAAQEGYTKIALAVSLYAANDTLSYGSLGSALPYSYTVAAGDQWGQLVLLHFSVTRSGLLPKVGDFLSSGGGCSPGPCDAQRFSDALVFDCLQSAATASGCSEVWSSGMRYSASPIINYTVTVWYPSYDRTGEPASANCAYQVGPVGSLGVPPPAQYFGYCLPVNSTSFVVSPQ